MSGNIELAVAIFFGLWLGQSATISDYGGKIYFDIIGLLIDKGIDTEVKAILLWIALGLVAGLFDIGFMSVFAFIVAEKVGEASVCLAKERYLPPAGVIKTMPEEARQVSLFDYDK